MILEWRKNGGGWSRKVECFRSLETSVSPKNVKSQLFKIEFTNVKSFMSSNLSGYNHTVAGVGQKFRKISVEIDRVATPLRSPK